MDRRAFVFGGALVAGSVAASVAHAQPAALVRDVNATADTTGSSSPQPLATTYPRVAMAQTLITAGGPIRGTFYFSATDARNGRELWKTDGTPAGTSIVKDINPGPAPADSSFGEAAALSSTLIVVVDDGVHGWEIWRSDGTAEGTFLLKDITPGKNGSSIGNLRVFGGKMYFDVGASGGPVTWVTDGTQAGTMVASVNGDARIPSSSPSAPGTAAALTYYWLTKPNGTRLWQSDGTVAGTRVISDGLPPRKGDDGLWPGNGLLATSDKIYSWLVTRSGVQTWATLAVIDRKTYKVKVILDWVDAGSGDGQLFEYGGHVYFDARAMQEQYTDDVPLWKTDGTAAGTARFTQSGTQASGLGYRHAMFQHGGKLFFLTSRHGAWMLSSTDGSQASIAALTYGNSAIGDPRIVNGTLLFTVERGQYTPHINEIWTSDGTIAGTHVWQGMPAGKTTSSSWLKPIDGTVFTDANDGTNGQELWRIDAGKLSLVKDMGRDDGSSNPYPVGDLGGRLLFGARVPASGIELYATDSTSAGTSLVKDIFAGAGDAVPGGLGKIGSRVLFAANNGALGSELWSTDGTTGGTSLVKDINVGAQGSKIASAAVLGSKIIFSANDGKTADEPWTTDGTATGTALLKDLCNGLCPSLPMWFTTIGSTVYFAARDTNAGMELFQTSTNPTAASTIVAADVRPGQYDSSPSQLFAFNGALYFSASDGHTGRELWKHGASTQLVKDIHAGAGDSTPQTFVAVGSVFFFVADDGQSGPELWKSDGTAAGTVRVKDIRAGASGADIRDLTNVGGTLLFTANDGVSGRELWKSDGTAAGTVVVKDIWPGDFSSVASGLFLARPGVVVFAASDGIAGVELWRSDGTVGGTRLVQDFAVGAGSSNPFATYIVGDRIYVSAYGTGAGRELFSAPVAGL